jgi:Transport and Golgi organisation 2
MCTVSFVSQNGKSIITSNRDEKTVRPPAIEPRIYSINNKNICFPKDPKAGGTWFATDQNGTVLVLLNGAKKNHFDQNYMQKNYRKSRGLIVLDIISSPVALDFWHQIELHDIEPFTLILFENNQLFQLRWNEIEKETVKLDTKNQYIWSSSTLYSPEIQEVRQIWFNDFLEKKIEITNTQLFDFHKNKEVQNKENGLLINRNNTTKTQSITQAIAEKNKITILHLDLIANKNFETIFLTI